MQKKVTFFTGNADKAKYMSKLLDMEIDYEKVDLPEIQELDLEEVVRYKVREAYEALQKPVFVDDISLEFEALNGLPGPLIRWFVESLSMQQMADLIKPGEDRSAIARCVIGYYDGENEVYFSREVPGKIATEPKGDMGYGWDPIFIPEGYEITRGEMTEEQYDDQYRLIRPLSELKEYLESLGY